MNTQQLLNAELDTYRQRIKAARDCMDGACLCASIDYAKLAAISAWHGVMTARELGDLDQVIAWQEREEAADAMVARLESAKEAA